MDRRRFLESIALLTGGLLVSKFAPAKSLLLPGQKIKGRVTSGNRAVAGVVISDGYSVVTTDRKGRYELEPNSEAIAIFISTPAGYEFPHDKNIARHYVPIKEATENAINFTLTKLTHNDDEHRFVIWADPQVKNASDVDKMMQQAVPDVQKLVTALPAGALIHGITVGDIVWDELKLFADYNKAVEKMGIPFFQCLGNHDMDYRKGGDETSDDTFQQVYGPTYYSFNRGQVHYVVMDNVRYLGKDRDYDGFIQQHQLDWLQKDLSFVPKDRLIVLCMHIPVHSGTKNKQDLYALLQDRKVHIMSGHTHYHVNSVEGNIYEHNHGTVCGAWWTGPICGDGTPCGYGVYEVKGTDLHWHYQSTGHAADYQLSINITDFDASQNQAIVNIWNHDPEWKTEYWVDGIQKGALEQFEGFDIMAYKTLLGPDLPKPRGFAEPKKTKHLFKAIIPNTAKEIKVMATDRFGKQFYATQKAQIS